MALQFKGGKAVGVPNQETQRAKSSREQMLRSITYQATELQNAISQFSKSLNFVDGAMLDEEYNKFLALGDRVRAMKESVRAIASDAKSIIEKAPFTKWQE